MSRGITYRAILIALGHETHFCVLVEILVNRNLIERGLGIIPIYFPPNSQRLPFQFNIASFKFTFHPLKQRLIRRIVNLLKNKGHIVKTNTHNSLRSTIASKFNFEK